MNILEGGDTSFLRYVSGINPISAQHKGTEIKTKRYEASDFKTKDQPISNISNYDIQF